LKAFYYHESFKKLEHSFWAWEKIADREKKLADDDILTNESFFLTLPKATIHFCRAVYQR
jgi:hypothetical protein